MAKAKPAINPNLIVLSLAAIVAAGANGTYASPDSLSKFVADGLVEINQANVDANGNVAVRATEKGTNAVNTQTATTAPVKAKVSFEIEDGIAIPERTRSGGGAHSKYPFDALQAGQSFFVAATEDQPNPAKSLASTITSANIRYSKDDPSGATRVNTKGATVPKRIAERKFQVVAFTKELPDGSKVEGARVFRIA